MPPITSTPTKKITKRTIKLAAIGLVTLALIVAAVIAGMYFIQKSIAAANVKDELNKIIPVLESKRQQTGAYPSTISDVLSTADSKVKLTGSTSFDGTSYCVTGINVSDKTAEFYIDSTKKDQGPVSGSCENRADLPVPLAVGGLAIAFSTSTDVKLTWNATSYATSYTLQCSDNSNFTTPVTVTVNENSGTCEKLKPNTSYFCRVKATNKVGDGSWSAVLKINTQS